MIDSIVFDKDYLLSDLVIKLVQYELDRGTGDQNGQMRVRNTRKNERNVSPGDSDV